MQSPPMNCRRPSLVDYISYPWTLSTAAAFRCTYGEVVHARLCWRNKRFFAPRMEGSDGRCSPDISSSKTVACPSPTPAVTCLIHKAYVTAATYVQHSHSASTLCRQQCRLLEKSLVRVAWTIWSTMRAQLDRLCQLMKSMELSSTLASLLGNSIAIS